MFHLHFVDREGFKKTARIFRNFFIQPEDLEGISRGE